MADWKTLTSETVLSAGKWLTVEDRTVETPTGQVIEHWAWIITPDYVNVLAQTEAGEYLVFRQGKYALKGESLAPIGGYVEPGEDPMAAAKRELMEETGYEAGEWHALGRFNVDPNRGFAMGDFFLARGARKVAERNADDLEEQHLLKMQRGELQTALREGKFKVMAWAAIVALGLLFDGTPD
jgi:ADP-ribose pyrophosphatase